MIMNNCLFCKIIAGEISSTRVFEDDKTVAFLDINPVNKGHTLVVPKIHAENFIEASTQLLCDMMGVMQKVARGVLAATGAVGFNLHVNNGRVSGQEVDHLHLHIIPRFPEDGLKHWPKVSYAEGEMKEVGKVIKSKIDNGNN